MPITANTPASAGTGTLTGNRTEEGWQRYFELHEDPSNDAVGVTFTQPIGATDALRTGTYAKTLTYTLSTTMP